MYPLKFKSIYVEKLWAGNKMKHLKQDVIKDNIGISWDLGAHKNADNFISNGAFKGMKFSEVIKKQGTKLIGKNIQESQILRTGILDAGKSLSIQVHPYQEYAELHENDNSKNETWYIIDADEGAWLTAGTTTTDVKVLRKAVENGILEDYIVKVPVKKGDIVVIKTGLLHALGKGILALEIGENGDTTYRFYDYNRGRKLDIEKSFDVLDVKQRCFKPKYITVSYEGYKKSYCYFDKEYAIEIIDVDIEYKEQTNGERYYIYTCVEGQGKIKCISAEDKIKSGESVFMPASLGEYLFEGRCRLLRSYIPDVNKVKNEILSYVTIGNQL